MGHLILVIDTIQDAFCYDNHKWENNKEQENMCIEIKKHNIAGMGKESAELYINNITIKYSFGTSSMYNISLTRWEIQMKKNRWSKEGKIVANKSIYYCVSVSLTVLGLVRSQQEAIWHFNKTE